MKQKNKVLSFLGIILSACLLYSVSIGLRTVNGIMLEAIASETGTAYSAVSLAAGIGQLVFGIVQPLFGVLALKRSNRLVLLIGCVLLILSLVAAPFYVSPWLIVLFFGIVQPAGCGALSFGIIMSTATPRLGEEKSAAASGILNASSTVCGIFFSPLLQSAYGSLGFNTTMIGFGCIAVLLVPVAFALSKKPPMPAVKQSANESILSLGKRAFKDKLFIIVCITFFISGVHMAIVNNHLYSEIISYGIPDKTAALVFSVYGIAGVCGAFLVGILCGKLRNKWVYGFLIGSRVLWILMFLLLPKKPAVIFLFAIFVGCTGNAVTTPISGILCKSYGVKNIAALYGVAFVAHQIGSFLSTWITGICAEQTGSYVLMWCVSAVVSLIGMFLCFRIDEPDHYLTEEA